MFDPTATRELLARAVHERDAINAAFRKDAESPELKARIDKWRRKGGLQPAGAVTAVLEECQPRYGTPPITIAYQRACADAETGGLARELWPKLEAVKAAHEALWAVAVERFDDLVERIERDRRPYLRSRSHDDHNRAVLDLHDLVAQIGGSTTDSLEPETKNASKPSPQKKRSRYRWVAEALELLKEHPEWDAKRIASQVGVHPGTLSKCEEFQRARRGNVRTARHQAAKSTRRNKAKIRPAKD